MVPRRKIIALVSTLFVAQLASCSSDDPVKTSSLVWTACVDAASLDCSSLKVPMDYDDPDGEKIDIALIRRKATGTDRKGSLVFNPGGPGASGVAVIKQFDTGEESEMPSSILAAYDLVGFDPRGVGDSRVVDCSDEGTSDIDIYPKDETAIAEMHAAYTELAANCQTKYGNYLQYLGSINVVRDMDKIRIELGEDKLNFIGYSYGTRLAALYLQDFPEQSGRIVLDASGDPDPSLRTLISSLIPQMQKNMLAVLSNCVDSDPNCSPEDLMDQLTDRVNALSAPTSMAEAQEFYLLIGVSSVASRDPDFGQLLSTPMLAYLNSGDVTVLQQFLQLEEAMDDGSDDDSGDNETVAKAILCADDATRADVDTLVAELDQFNQISDLFAELEISQLAKCSGWPEALEPLSPIVTSTAPLSLVIGGSTDAQAPLAASEDMAIHIGGIFISSNHSGHTAVFNGESDCVDGIVESFLLDGLTPTVTECD